MSQGRSLHRPGGMNTPLLPVSAPAQSGATSSQYQYQGQGQRLHRLGARILGGFALLHLLNHLAALRGVAAHQQVLEVLKRRGMTLQQALAGLSRVPQQTVNVRIGQGVSAKAIMQSDAVVTALAAAQQAVAGRGRAFLRPSGTEPVVRVTVEADDAALMQSTLDALAEAVRAAAT